MPANGLAGPLPDSIGELVYLKQLNLNGNAVNGSIPAAFGTPPCPSPMPLRRHFCSRTLFRERCELRCGARTHA